MESCYSKRFFVWRNEVIKVSDIGNLEEYRVATMSETIGDCGEIDVVILIKIGRAHV